MKSSVFSSSSKRRKNGARRGFTLIELMVALSGGLFLSMVVFALARDTNRFYAQQTRLANATLSGIVGFDRLRADIGRAGFLTTPNILGQDPHVCSVPGDGWPDRLRYLRSIRLVKESAAATTELSDNGILPMSLTLAGSYTSADEFPVRTVYSDDSGATTLVYLQVNTGAMARLGYDVSGADGGDSTTQQTLLESVFRPKTILRIVDQSGQQHYGVISSVTGGVDPYITLDTGTAPLTFRSTGERDCGLKGLEFGATTNVVNIIRYDIRSLKGDANYSALFAPGVKAPEWDDRRADLVRTELDVDGTAVGAPELVAEYAVDLQFGFTVWENGKLNTYDTDDSAFATYFDDSEAAVTNMQRVRAVRAHLAVRSREPDRAANVDTAALPGMYRIGLGKNGGAPFARVRNFQADIALHNHGRTEW